MSKKHCTKHHRNASGYSRRKKGRRADQYGTYHEGRLLSPDRLVAWVVPMPEGRNGDRN